MCCVRYPTISCCGYVWITTKLAPKNIGIARPNFSAGQQFLPHTSSVRTADLNGGVSGAPHRAVGDTRTAAAGGVVLLGTNNTSPS